MTSEIQDEDLFQAGSYWESIHPQITANFPKPGEINNVVQLKSFVNKQIDRYFKYLENVKTSSSSSSSTKISVKKWLSQDLAEIIKEKFRESNTNNFSKKKIEDPNHIESNLLTVTKNKVFLCLLCKDENAPLSKNVVIQDLKGRGAGNHFMTAHEDKFCNVEDEKKFIHLNTIMVPLVPDMEITLKRIIAMENKALPSYVYKLSEKSDKEFELVIINYFLIC